MLPSIVFLSIHAAGLIFAVVTFVHAWNSFLLPILFGDRVPFLLSGIVIVFALAAVELGGTVRRRLRRQPEPNAGLRLRVLLYVALGCVFVDVFILALRWPLSAEVSATFAYGVYAVWTLLLPRLQRVVPRRLRVAADVVCMNAVLILILAEVALRVAAVFWPTPLLVTPSLSEDIRRVADRVSPGTVRFGFPVNKTGHYDTDLAPRAPDDKLVVSIGDSFSYGIVPHAFHFTTVSEQALRGVEVYNMGFPGTGPIDYRYLLEHEALALKPDLAVIQLFVGNDLNDGVNIQDPPRWYTADSYMVSVVWHRLKILKREGLIDFSRVAEQQATTRAELIARQPWLADPLVEEARFSKELYLQLMLEHAEAISSSNDALYARFFQLLEDLEQSAGDTPLAFVLIPDEYQVEDHLWEEVRQRSSLELDRDRPQQKIMEWAKARGRPVLDLLPLLRSVEPMKDGRRHVYHLQDTHFNARGNDVAGRALARFARPFLSLGTSLPLQISFGDSAGREFMKSGWHQDENDGSSEDGSFVWSDGLESVLEIPLPNTADVRMTFESQPFVFPGSPRQQVSVVLNGKPIDRLSLNPGRQTYSVILPRSALLDSPNRLEFQYAYARAPHDVLPSSADQRRLAVAWYSADFISAGKQDLSYGGRASDRIEIEGGFSLKLELKGPEDRLKALRESNAALALHELTFHGEGERVIGSAGREGVAVGVGFQKVHVNGTASAGPFQFDFEQAKPPADLSKDPVRQLSWGLSMGRRNFKLGPKGDYQGGDAGSGATGEAMNMILDGAVRFPNMPIDVGEEWTNQWMGTVREKDSGGIFEYRQKARLEAIVPGGSPRARISFNVTGSMAIPPDRNKGRDEVTTFEGHGAILLNLLTGEIVAIDTAGTITSDFKAAGFAIVRGMAAKYAER
jgi:hypothetical protein